MTGALMIMPAKVEHRSYKSATYDRNCRQQAITLIDEADGLGVQAPCECNRDISLVIGSGLGQRDVATHIT